MIISQGDLAFLKDAMHRLNIRKPIRVYRSDSKKKYPDIWVITGKDPIEIWVTDEWARQSVRERRKRLIHEVAGHVAFDWPHNSYMDKLGFTSRPNTDTMSMRIYDDLYMGKVKSPNMYIKEALYELGKSKEKQT